KNFPFCVYLIWYEGSSTAVRFGNSFFKSSKATPSEPNTGLDPKSINLVIMGIHLTECPIPQLSGATNMFFDVDMEVNINYNKEKKYLLKKKLMICFSGYNL